MKFQIPTPPKESFGQITNKSQISNIKFEESNLNIENWILKIIWSASDGLFFVFWNLK